MDAEDDRNDDVSSGGMMTGRVQVFLNPRSGGAGGGRARVEAGFRAAGVECEVVEIGPGVQVEDRARKTAERGERVVVSAGGDGTVNAVAAGVAGTGGCMGVLPVGTLNHFARDLGIPMELEGAIGVIGRGERRKVDVGEVNGRVFVNNSSVGIYAEMVAMRERLQRRGLGKWGAMAVASARAVVRFRRIDVRMTVEGKQIRRRTPILFVGNNEYRVEGTRIGSRARLDGGQLYVYLTPGLTRLGMVKIALAALVGRVKEVKSYEQFCVTELTVDLRKRVCRVSLDGEVRRMDGPLTYRIRPGALDVFAPGKV